MTDICSKIAYMYVYICVCVHSCTILHCIQRPASAGAKYANTC